MFCNMNVSFDKLTVSLLNQSFNVFTNSKQATLVCVCVCV